MRYFLVGVICVEVSCLIEWYFEFLHRGYFLLSFCICIAIGAIPQLVVRKYWHE